MESKRLAALPSSSSPPDAAADGFYSLGYRRPPGAYGSAAAAKTYYYYGERPVRALVCALVLDGFGGFRFRFVFNSGKSLLSPQENVSSTLASDIARRGGGGGPKANRTRKSPSREVSHGYGEVKSQWSLPAAATERDRFYGKIAHFKRGLLSEL